LQSYDRRGRAALRPIQAGARTSMAWFERADRYLDRDAVDFAYSMAGRQGAQPPWRYQMHRTTQLPAVRAALRGINSGRRWYLARRRGETPALAAGSR
jgi:anthraniloyl-CoA monooxygenase